MNLKDGSRFCGIISVPVHVDKTLTTTELA